MARILTTLEYLATPRPQLNWLVDQLIPHPGLILLEGPPKTAGKSFLALDLARSVAQGQPFLGWNTHKSRVLYLQFDTSELIWRERLEKLSSSGLDFSGDLFCVHPEDMLLPINLVNPKHYDWLTKVVEQSDPHLTIVDVFREIHSVDENDSTGMKIVGDLLMSIFRGRSLILVHHSKKISDEIIDPDPSSVSRGSSYITGKVDAIWLLYNNRLRIQSRVSEPISLALKQGPGGIWELA